VKRASNLVSGRSGNPFRLSTLVFEGLCSDPDVLRSEVNDESFDLKSDFCIDYDNAFEEGSNTWKSIKDALDEAKVSFRDYQGAIRNQIMEVGDLDQQIKKYKDMIQRKSDTHIVNKEKYFAIKNEKSYITTGQDPRRKASVKEVRFVEKKEATPKFLENNEAYRTLILGIYERQQVLLKEKVEVKDAIVKPRLEVPSNQELF